MVVNLSNTVTQEAFGDLVGISQQTVSELLMRGVLVQGASAGEWLRSYTSHLREMAAGRAASGDLDLAGERARLAKAQADRVEMQNAVTRGELAPVVWMEEILCKAASKIAGIFDAIPGMVRRRVPQLTADDIDLIAGEIAKARNAVAAMSLADINDSAPADDTESLSAPTIEAATDE
jgi:phage terminase Nu1 subunit (DNA packaging protein)